jgi:hypothetical protein
MIDYDSIVTDFEDPATIYVEKQRRLLTASLYSSWPGPGDSRPFLALSNVGLFYRHPGAPLLPDVMLSLDVAAAKDLHAKENRAYFTWVFGKPPDVAIEIVSDRREDEDSVQMKTYARIGVPIYAIYDPEKRLRNDILSVHGLTGGRYKPIEPTWLPDIGLGLVLWQGSVEEVTATWLRWCDAQGQVILTGAERANGIRRRADEERRRADDAIKKLADLQAQLFSRSPDVTQAGLAEKREKGGE